MSRRSQCEIVLAERLEFPLEPLVAKALKHALRGAPDLPIASDIFEHRVEDALRQAVEDAVSGIVKETVIADRSN